MSTLRPAKITIWYILRENALQLIMYVLGAALMGLAWWPLAILYLALAAATNIFYMYWVCPYCGHYALGACAAGFDLLSGRRFRARLGRTFRGQFRLGTVVVGLGWFLPPLAALVLLIVRFSWVILVLLAVFCVVAFWLLPEVSKKHCDGCETVDCPRRPKEPRARD
ncbi:MAG: hypothetical protein FD146_2601 [Anaerolineaceae bacterium]|nr:MAG: hypothetical protein FD146_2601 [Anaerolineaceae bacterium]